MDKEGIIMKKIYILFLTIIMQGIAVLPALSEGWVYGQFNTWYERSDGSRLSNGKYTIDGDDYIFDFEGNRVFNQWTILTDGERYYSLSDGRVAKNQWINDTFYVDETGAMVRGRSYNGIYFDIDGFVSNVQPSPAEPSAQSSVQSSLPENSAFYEIEAENFDAGFGILPADEGGIIELHIDSLNGPLIGTCRISGTESWEAWKDFSCEIEPVRGVRDLYLVFRGKDGYLFNMNFFHFTSPNISVSKSAYRVFAAGRFNDCSGVFGENYGANIGYIENGDWVMYKSIDFEKGAGSAVVRASALFDGGTIEFRLDSTDGPLAGTCPVTNTEGWGYYYDFDCVISGAKGIHDLYLVFRGGSGYLFNIQLFRFGK